MRAIYPGKEQPYPPQMTRYLDPVPLWTVAATATNRVRLNASTLSTFYYEPTHLARQLTTLDVLSDGRLDIRVGVGWMKDEHDTARGADCAATRRRWPRNHHVGQSSDGLTGLVVTPRSCVTPRAAYRLHPPGFVAAQRHLAGCGRRCSPRRSCRPRRAGRRICR